MNMFKKNGGFTLVELIVVIAILAILAGVAIPAYSGYIRKSQDAAVIAELDALLTAAQAATAARGSVVKMIVNHDCSICYIITDSDMEHGWGKEFAEGQFRSDILAFFPSLDPAENTSPYHGCAWDTDGDGQGDIYNRYMLKFTNPLAGWENSSFAVCPAGKDTAGAVWENGEWTVGWDNKITYGE